MKISVIIPTFNGEKYIFNLIPLLKSQSLLPSEIIIIDSSSDDKTVEICKEFDCKTIIIKRKDFDHGATRKLGAEVSGGEIIIFMTQDALPINDKLIENLVKPLHYPKIAASFGRQVPKINSTPLEKFARLYNYPEKSNSKSIEDLPRLGIRTFFFSNVCSAIRKKEYQAVGGFPERIIVNEDMVLAAKLMLSGYHVSYVPEATVLHSHNYKLLQQFRRYFDIGAFHNTNRWLFELSRPEGEGLHFTKEQFLYLFRNGYHYWIPYSLVANLIKYFGYRLGLTQDKLPLFLKKSLSNQRIFWNKI